MIPAGDDAARSDEEKWCLMPHHDGAELRSFVAALRDHTDSDLAHPRGLLKVANS